jgi:Uma2 family endonuclease
MSTSALKAGDDLPVNLTVDQFLAWVAERPGHFELHDGTVVAMAPERVGHSAIKGRVYRALGDAISRAGLTCHALPDGVAVQVDDKRWYEPNALVYCGAEVPGDALSIANPIIVVEVSSPSTARFDEFHKIIGYFSLPSIEHYLIVYPDRAPVIHHKRRSDGTILTSIVPAGRILLDPPGIELDVAALLG